MKWLFIYLFIFLNIYNYYKSHGTLEYFKRDLQHDNNLYRKSVRTEGLKLFGP